MTNQILKNYIPTLLLPSVLGILSGVLAGNISLIYASLNLPPLSPPTYVFGIVWPILYILMGVSCYLVCQKSPSQTQATLPYAFQLFLNFIWPILFFRIGNFLIASLVALCLSLAIIWMIYVFYQIDPAAAYLQIPYLLWSLFANYLCWMITFLN